MPNAIYWLGWNLVVTFLMAIVAWILCKTPMLRRRPAICHALWLLVLLKLVTPPIVPVPVLPAVAAAEQPVAPLNPVAVSFPKAGCDNPALPIGNSATVANATTELGELCCPSTAANVTESLAGTEISRDANSWNGKQTVTLLFGISLFVTCILWLVAIRRILQVRRLLRGNAGESARATELLREVSRRFSSQAPMKLHVVDAPVTPMLWAMPLNPAIVLPRPLLDSLDDNQLRSILAHELGHFFRRDHWADLFAWGVTTLFWWNPVAWFARRQLRAAAETCCDAVALERLSGSRKAYANALLTVVDSLTPTLSLRSPLGIAFGESHSLRRRFESIADANVRARMTRSGWLLLALGVATSLLIPARAQEQVAATEKTAESPSESIDMQDNQVGGIRCRLIAVQASVDDEAPSSTDTTNEFARSNDVTFVVELKNVSDKPETLLGVRLGDSYGKAQGKLSTASFAPHLFEFEFIAPDGTPIHRPKREYTESMIYLSGASTHEIEPGQSLTVVLRPTKFASPMGYELPPGNYRVKVRYHGPTEKMVTRMKEIWPDEPQAKAWTGEVTSNEVSFTVSDDPHAPQPAELKWGKPKDGLRAAVSFQALDDNGSPVKQVNGVPVNSKLDVTLHLQNVSEQPISLVSETWRQGDLPVVRDEEGKLRYVGGTTYTGIAMMVRWTLNPGEIAQIQSAALGVAANEIAAAQMNHPIGKRFIAKPGNYSLRYSIRLRDRQSRDGKGNVILPGPNDWQGELVTGDTPLQVRARTSKDDAGKVN